MRTNFFFFKAKKECFSTGMWLCDQLRRGDLHRHNDGHRQRHHELVQVGHHRWTDGKVDYS